MTCIFSPNSRKDPADARVGKVLFPQYVIDVGTHCQKMSWMFGLKGEDIYRELLN